MSDTFAPEPEAVETEIVSEEAPSQETLDDVVSETPEVETVEAVEEVPEVEDPYATWGGKDTIEKAHKMWEAAQTEQGVVQLWLEAGRSLGLGLKQMEELFGTPGAASAEAEVEVEEEDPDRLLTYREFQELQAKDRQSAAEVQQAAAVETARTTIAETLTSVGVSAKDPTADLILKLADKHMADPTDLSPETVANAVRRGHAEFVALVEAEQQKRIASKVAVAKTIPKAPGGAAAPSAAPESEPRDVAEAILRMRRAQAAG